MPIEAILFDKDMRSKAAISDAGMDCKNAADFVWAACEVYIRCVNKEISYASPD